MMLLANNDPVRESARKEIVIKVYITRLKKVLKTLAQTNQRQPHLDSKQDQLINL